MGATLQNAQRMSVTSAWRGSASMKCARRACSEARRAGAGAETTHIEIGSSTSVFTNVSTTA